MNVCTIIAKNYIAHARVLARSFSEHHLGKRLRVLIIDDFAGYIDRSDEPFDILTPGDIGCAEFEDMAARYTILELSTAVKPWLLRHLLADVGAPVTYLDPDIQVFASLEHLDDLAAQHGVVLTPHNATPIPQDGRRPSQVDIMIAGVYNLGYLSLAPRPEVDRLLDWWAERLVGDCRVDPTYGYFVDQRWFDLVPGFVADFAIVREPEYNVAYWNLHSRVLEHDGERYIVDGRPLAFFHFSGFNPDVPTELSRHQNRVQLSGNPALERICGEYVELMRREGIESSRHWPYTFGTLPSGLAFDDLLRGLYMSAAEHGELDLSPFSSDGEAAFLDWLGGQEASAPPGVHRLLAHVYGTRPDLQNAFPDLNGPGLGRLVEWVQTAGKTQIPALALLPLPEPARPGMHPPETSVAPRPVLAPAPSPWGVNVVGYFRSELGVGEAARQVVGALDAAAVPLLPLHGETIPQSRQGHRYNHFDHTDAEYPVNLICINADALPEFAGQAGRDFFDGRYSIGLWFWEVACFPEEWIGSFEFLDEVWLPTAHVAEAIAAVSPIPAATIRLPVELPPIVPIARTALGLSSDFSFLFSFDYRSVFQRKNPLAVVEAFSRAFESGEGASLLVKCINAEADPVNHALLKAAVAEHADVRLVDWYFTPDETNALTASCDCYVSLHRAEGFGLTMAEAMYCGKPVIATGYSGNLDFMTTENSMLVHHRMVRIGNGAAPYPPHGEWAEPDPVHAAVCMRELFDDRKMAAELGRRAAVSIRTTHSRAVAGELLGRRLQRLRERRGEWERARGQQSTRASLAALPTRGPALMAPPDAGSLRRAARRGALRAMRPYTAYQDSVNGSLVRSLAGLTVDLDATRARLTRVTAAILADTRSRTGLESLPAVVDAHGQLIDDVKHMLAAVDQRFEDVDKRLHDLEPGLQIDRNIYLAIAELRRMHEAVVDRPVKCVRRGELTPWELKGFSQNGEDGVIAEILGRIGALTHYFVEFGIESGREGNCVFLADVAGWSGLFIEADGGYFAELEQKYEHVKGVTTLSEYVTPSNVQELFARAGVPDEPDVLSIDVDGADYWIWEAIVDYRPRVVVIEYNSALDPAQRLVQPRDLPGWDGTDYFGASLGAIAMLADQKGYRLVHTELAAANAFLVREDLAAGRFPDVETVPMRTPPNYFQSGYRHPEDTGRRQYLDLDSGEMVDADVRRRAEAPAVPN